MLRFKGRGDLDAAVEMRGAMAVLVVAKRFERQRAERLARIVAEVDPAGVTVDAEQTDAT